MSTWHENPYLKDRFHPEYPDDIQVLIHDGGPRMSDHTPELVWVRVVRENPDHFVGILLNRPENIVSVKQGDEIIFIAIEHSPHPVLVTSKYLAERKDWSVEPCNKCGFAELFDAPSDLIRKIFPTVPEGSDPMAFTSFCAFCGGVQIVANNDFNDLDDLDQSDEKKWWQFWK